MSRPLRPMAFSSLRTAGRQLTTSGRRTLRRRIVEIPSPWGSVRSVRTQTSLVALTYDDGPAPVGTPEVLDALGEARARATFFVLADHVARAPELVRRAAADGHEIGLHGPDHRRLTALGRGAATALIADARRRVEDVIGRPVRLFRPPYGALTLDTLRAARTSGLDVVMWSVDGDDWRPEPPEALAARAVAQCRRGAVVLLHDNRADAAPDASRPGIDRGRLTRLVLEGLAARQMASVTVSDLCARGTVVRSLWFKS